MINKTNGENLLLAVVAIAIFIGFAIMVASTAIADAEQTCIIAKQHTQDYEQYMIESDRELNETFKQTCSDLGVDY